MRLACRIAAGPNRAPLRLVVPISNGMPATQIAAAAVAALDAEKGRRDGVGRGHRHDWAGGSANRNTAAATAQVQSPLAAPSAAAVIDRLSTMRSLSS